MTQVSEDKGIDTGAARAAGATVGSTLRGLRLSKGWSLEEVSSRIKFAPRQIDSLEHERWDELPGGVSLRGMVRNYASQVGADPQAMLTLLDPHTSPVGNVALSHARLHAGASRTPIEDERPSSSWGWLLTILVVLAVGLAYAFWQGWLPQHWLPSDWFPRHTS
jgi:cytoskeleton protein RodZ